MHYHPTNFEISKNEFRETYFETKPFLVKNSFSTDGQRIHAAGADETLPSEIEITFSGFFCNPHIQTAK